VNRIKEREIREISITRVFLSWKTLAAVIIAAIIIYAFFHGFKKEDIIRLGSYMRQINPAVFALAFVSYYLGYVFLGWRYKILLKNCGVDISIWRGTITCLMGAATNAALPTKVGDLYRAYLLRKYEQVPVGQGLGANMGERFLDLAFAFSSLFIISQFLFTWATQGSNIVIHLIIASSSSLLGLITLVLILLLIPATRRLVLAIFPGRTRLFMTGFINGVTGSLHHNWPWLILSTAMVWAAESLRLYFVTIALGVVMTIPQIVFIVMATTLLAAIPISFSGLGLVEGGATSLLKLFRIDTALGLATIICDRLISFASVVVLGFIAFLFIKDAS